MTKLNQDQICELISSFKKGTTDSLDTLMENFKPMVSSIARGYFLVGGDDEDLMQEGMIGLYKAILSYDECCSTTFSTFAYLCILRQVQTAVRASLRKNRAVLSNFISISNQGMIVVDEEKSGIYLVSSELNPEESLITAEQKSELSEIIMKKLSKFEFLVLGLYLKGFSYTDISQKLCKDIKSVSNAIARMRMKLQNYFGGEKCI